MVVGMTEGKAGSDEVVFSGGLGVECVKAPSLPYTLLQWGQSQVPGPGVRTPVLWGFNPKPVDPRSSRLGRRLSTSPQLLSLQPVTLAFPAPPQLWG